MKRYLLFCWFDYEGMGGWNDFVESYDTIKAAVDNVPRRFDNYHVIDIQTGEMVAEEDN